MPDVIPTPRIPPAMATANYETQRVQLVAELQELARQLGSTNDFYTDLIWAAAEIQGKNPRVELAKMIEG